MRKAMLVAGSFFGLTAVILGAFGAHALGDVLTDSSLATFETGVKYQMYHALLLLLVGGLDFLSEKAKKTVFYLWTIGIVLFSGSIYLLATNALTSFDFTTIALLTPLGGFLLILGWIFLLIRFIKLKH